MFRSALRAPRLPPRLYRAQHAAAAARSNVVKIVEVGPRDGLQNEKGVVDVAVKAELVDRLARLGLRCVEAGSFVSPKWVPQMAGTPEVLKRIVAHPGTSYPVLVPNQYGLDAFLRLLDEHPHLRNHLDEIAVFTAATDAFSRANTNCSVAESLERLAPVVAAAARAGLRARGYVSVVVGCPYEGAVAPRRVRDVARALVEMGCYEVSLGDTVGVGTPHAVRAVFEEVAQDVPIERLAGHFHDTYGMGVANALAALELGVRTLDSAVGGLGGCPFSPGATGNIATEDILYALRGSRWVTEGRAEDNLEHLAEVGWWISGMLGRETTSRVGKALWARRERERQQAAHAKL